LAIYSLRNTSGNLCQPCQITVKIARPGYFFSDNAALTPYEHVDWHILITFGMFPAIRPLTELL